uniref:Uncharacterized protein n=1 Tax=Arundo donax TaxID=35708 RepID=A0A0A9EM52_ARUDO
MGKMGANLLLSTRSLAQQLLKTRSFQICNH